MDDWLHWDKATSSSLGLKSRHCAFAWASVKNTGNRWLFLQSHMLHNSGAIAAHSLPYCCSQSSPGRENGSLPVSMLQCVRMICSIKWIVDWMQELGCCVYVEAVVSMWRFVGYYNVGNSSNSNSCCEVNEMSSEEAHDKVDGEWLWWCFHGLSTKVRSLDILYSLVTSLGLLAFTSSAIFSPFIAWMAFWGPVCRSDFYLIDLHILMQI